MLELVRIWNFQRHKFLEVEFDRRCTMFVGRNSAGKSAIVRALQWVLLNRSVRNMARKGASLVQVEVILDGRSIIRKKKGRHNLYFLDGKRLRAVGTKVPKPVADLVRMADLNIQEQHEPTFWLSLSPGQVSKELNKVVSLDVIDETLKNIGQDVRKCKTRVEVSEERLEEAERESAALAWVPGMAAKLDDLEHRWVKISELKSEILELETKAETARDLSDRLERLLDLSLAGKKAILIGQKIVDLRSKQARLVDLSAAARGLQKKLNLPQPSTRLIQLGDSIITLRRELRELGSLRAQARGLEKEECRLRKSASSREELLHKRMKGKTCPLCGRSTT